MHDPAPIAELFEVTREADLLPLGASWDRLALAAPFHVPTFSDIRALFRDPALRFRLIGLSRDGAVEAMAFFLLSRAERSYWLGERKLGGLSLPTATLWGCAMLGDPDEQAAGRILDRLLGASGDMVVLDDLPIDSGAYRAARARARRHPVRISHHNATRRLIDLPDTVAAYHAALRPSTRKALRRDLRLFDRHAPRFETYAGRAALDLFLPRAAALSRRTYQAGFGMGLDDSDHVRGELARLGAEGRLRAWLAVVEGQPIAFAWGEIAQGIFYFRMTGYDPAYARDCAGTALLQFAIEDLIALGGVRCFDFGIRDHGYKARFANRAVPCAHVMIGRWSSPRAVLAIAADRALDMVKRGAARLGRDRLRRIARFGRRA